MGNLNYRRIFAFAGSFSLLLVYIFLWAFMIADPKMRSGSDFSGFYTYGRIFETRGIAFIHDIEEQKRIQGEIVGYEVAPIVYTHLPMNAPLAAALVDENYVASFKRWAVVLLLLNALNVHLLIRLLKPISFTKENLVILSMGTFLFFPTFSGFINGREDVILMLGTAAWVAGVLSKRYFLAGLGLSLTAIRPQMALILAIPFFFRHRNVFWGFALGGSLLAGINLAVDGIDGAVKYIESIRYIENTVWYETHSFDMPTLSGIIRRNFEFADPGPVKILVWACYGLGIAAFSMIWHRSAGINEKHLGLISTASIFLLPYAHYHDLILLLIPIFCLIRIFGKWNVADRYYLSIGPLVISVLAAMGFAGSGIMKFPIAYAIMLGLGILLIESDKLIGGRLAPPGG